MTEQDLVIEDYDTYNHFARRDFIIIISLFAGFEVFFGILALVFKWSVTVFVLFLLVGIGVTMIAVSIVFLKKFSDMLYLVKSIHMFLVNIHNLFYHSMEEEEDADSKNTKKPSPKKR